MEWYEVTPLVEAFGLVSFLVYKLELVLWRWWQCRSIQNVVVVKHHSNTEMEAENKWLTNACREQARKIAKLERQMKLVRRDGKLEAMQECYFIARDMCNNDVAAAIEKLRQST